MANDHTENQAVIEFVEKNVGLEIINVINPVDPEDLGQFAVMPTGRSLVSVKKFIDEYRTKPERRKGVAVLTTEASFIAHVNRFKRSDSLLFADRLPDAPSILAVYDYNPAGPNNWNAAFGEHRAHYAFPLSEEWQAWIESNEEEMDALTFARFLEDRLQDVVTVDDASELRKFADLFGGAFAEPAKLLELSRSLDINASVTVKQAQTLSSGEINVAFSEEHRDADGRPIKVPNLFAIGIPVFVDGDKYRIACRLRYRLASGRVSWSYAMMRVDAYLDLAIKESVDRIQAATDITLDTGVGRSFYDAGVIAGHSYAQAVGPVIRWWFKYLSGSPTVGNYPTHQEMAQILVDHPQITESASFIAKLKVVRSKCGAGVQAFVHSYASEAYDRDMADLFMTDLNEGAALAVDSPIFALRKRLVDGADAKGRVEQSHVLAWSIKAWNAWVAGEKLKAIKWQSTGEKPEPFPRFKNEVAAPAPLKLVKRRRA